jgi:hypothetical protein
MVVTRRRIIVNTDAKNEADDQFAIVHALLSPSLDVRGLIAAHYGTSRSDRSMKESREEIDLPGHRAAGDCCQWRTDCYSGRADAQGQRGRPVDHRGEQACQSRHR